MSSVLGELWRAELLPENVARRVRIKDVVPHREEKRERAVLTDAELPANEPVSKSLCGNCTACVDACPGNAMTGNDWRAGLRRDLLYDAFVCRETALKIAATRIGIRLTLCGICINVCPWTQKYIAGSG